MAQHDHLQLILESLAAIEASVFADLVPCGPAAISLLGRPLNQVLEHIDQDSQAGSSSSLTVQNPVHLSHIHAQLSAIIRLCDDRFLAFPYATIPTCWRRLYTDAAILKACAALALPNSTAETEETIWRSLVKDLDLAIIIAGSPGPGRRELVLQLIRACQHHLSPSIANSVHHSEDTGPSRKRAKLDPASCGQYTLTAAADTHIPELTQPPTLEEFLRPRTGQYLRPFILRGFAHDWPALMPEEPDKLARWDSTTYLERLSGPGRVVPVEVGAKYTDHDWGQDIILWSDFLRQTAWGQRAAQRADSSGTAAPLYLAQHALLSQFPQLEDDMILPDFVYASPSPPTDCPAYRPPANEEQLIINAWIGPEGTVSPPHHDMYYNCFVQVVGHKEIWLAPPQADQHGQMSAYGTLTDADEREQSIGTSLMTNTSQIDVFAPSAVPELFDSQVRPLAQRAILGPGDLLFMPPGWWHSLKSLSKVSFAVMYHPVSFADPCLSLPFSALEFLCVHVVLIARREHCESAVEAIGELAPNESRSAA